MIFDIGFYYSVNGFMEIEAETSEEAEVKVMRILEEDGIEDEAKVDVIDRDYNTTGEKFKWGNK